MSVINRIEIASLLNNMAMSALPGKPKCVTWF